MGNIKKTLKSMGKALIKPQNKLSLIPNWLSFSRAIGGVLIPVMIYTNAPVSILSGTLIFIALSDFLDGKVARLLVKEETKEGAMLDAISDKIFSISLIIGLIPKMPSFLLNGALESAISYINAKRLSKGKTPKSTFIGKIKTWPLSISLILGYLNISLASNNITNINLAKLTNGLIPINLPSFFIANTAVAISAITSILELKNIQEYNNADKEEIKITNHKEIKEETKEQDKSKTKKLSLDKKTKLKAMVYEIPQSSEKKSEIVISKTKKKTK